jgi:Tfp pilus assembly protein PilF
MKLPPIATDELRGLVELARTAVEAGHAQTAEKLYYTILQETESPKSGIARVAHGEAAVWFARKALHMGRLGTALDWYRRALSVDPRATEYRIEFCIRALLPMGMVKDARIEAERATRIEPTSAEAWRTLGGIEHKMGNVDASVAAYDRQLELLPDDPNAMLDRATIALDTSDYDMVRLLCLNQKGTPREADALHCLGMVAYREGHHKNAVALYNQAIAGGCHDVPLCRWNKSLALHSLGRYREGWAEHEQRGKQKTDPAMAFIMNRFVVPMWAGEPAPLSLHVHQEMGFGDAIAMARYLPILAQQGYDVRCEVSGSLVGLFARSFPGVTVMDKALDYPGALGIPPFDRHVPMLSLPYLMGTEVDTMPWSGPYLKADPGLVQAYKDKLGQRDGRCIGLCWSAGVRHEGVWLAEYGRRKSITLAQLDGLIYSSDDQFVSLQVGPERAEVKTFPGNLVRDVLPKTPTWDDTAALIECLDLVVTVDTAVAHLAGAIGKPVLLMMHTEGSWHWMAPQPGAMWNDSSPWYPSVKIFRQDKPHEWGDVIARIATELGVP